jgi:serine/threonine protein kinase
MSVSCPYCFATNPDTAQKCHSCGMALSSANASQALPSGTVLAGRYTVYKVLGEGGFGITYTASDNSLRRGVAIKELFPEGAHRTPQGIMPPRTVNWPQYIQRFIEEAQVLAGLSHPSIVKVFDVFQENSTAYYVMELLQGKTLAEMCLNNPLEPKKAVHVTQQLGDALKLIHAQNLLHRDIKPENVMVTTNQQAVLIDFGSARQFGAATMKHTQLVTPGYAPLEQYASQARVQPATDIYSLGATLFTMLTGSPPPAATDRFGGAILDFPATVPNHLRDAIEWAMQMRIDDRPANVDAWLAKLNPATQVISPWRMKLADHTDSVHSVTYSPDGSRIVTGSEDNTAIIWDAP